MAIYLISFIIPFSLGHLGTFHLSHVFSVHAIITSCLITLTVGLLRKASKETQSLIYCGTFSGMSASSHFVHWYQHLVACLLGGIIFYLLRNRLKGFGGKFGSIAFISALAASLVGGLST
ncbi:MAG: hypothetical protein ACI9QD_000472 [Thermoproteota archaeon]|jgi:hypothetical protein